MNLKGKLSLKLFLACVDLLNKFGPSEEDLYEHEQEQLTVAILNKLPTLLKTGSMVWCRNSEACRIATPCSSLECNYKSKPEDIVGGCSKCKGFQITSISDSWRYAKHTHGPNSVEPEGN